MIVRLELQRAYYQSAQAMQGPELTKALTEVDKLARFDLTRLVWPDDDQAE